MLIGSVGWRHRHWQDSFYPDTLPEDWWLTYYSNEFGCVLVPVAQLGQTTIAAWRDDTHERFRFFLELGPDPDWVAAGDAAQSLGSRLGGILCRSEDLPSPEQAPVRRLLDAGVLLVVDDGADHPWLRAGIAQPLWRPGSPVSGCPVGLVPEADRDDRRQLRRHVEDFGRQAGHGGSAEPALFLTGEQLRPETLRDAAVIAGLLGF